MRTLYHIIIFIFFFFIYSLTQALAKQQIPAQVYNLTDENFDSFLQQSKGNRAFFLMFYAPWCPHCIRLKPTWAELAEELFDVANVGMIDCEQNPKLKNRFSITGFPTLIYIHKNKMYEYSGYRDLQSLTEFAKKGYKEHESEEIPKEGSFFKSFKKSLYKAFKRLYEMALINPWKVGGSVAAFLLLIIGSCVCSAWLANKLARPINKRVNANAVNEEENVQRQDIMTDSQYQRRLDGIREKVD